MEDLSTPAGIALIAVGIFVAVKAVKTVVKVAMIVVILAGAYLWFGMGGGIDDLRNLTS